jgi:hypothetical protein
MKEWSKNGLGLGVIFAFCCCFLFLGWIIFSGFTIGNDFPYWQTQPTLYYRFFQLQGVEPTWYPHYSGGVPIGGFPTAQMFHLPTWLMSFLPGYWNGSALRWLAFRDMLLFIGLQVGILSYFGKYLKLPKSFLFLLSIPFVFNLRALDALRYGAYFEATAYCQLTLIFTIFYFDAESLKRKLWCLIGAGSTLYLLLTIGYPPMMIYSAYGFIASGMLIYQWKKEYGFGHFCSKMLPVLFVGIAVVLLSAPFWMGSIDAAFANAHRVQNSTFVWAQDHYLTYRSLLWNFLRPWDAEVHSMFLGSTLIAVCFLAFFMFLLTTWRKNGLLLILMLIPLLYALGPETPVCGFLFKHVVGFGWVRVPGRMLVLLYLFFLAALPSLRDRGRYRKFLKLACVTIGIGMAASLVAEAVLMPNHLHTLNRDAVYTPQIVNLFWQYRPKLEWLIAGLAICFSLWWMLKKEIEGFSWPLLLIFMGVIFQTHLFYHHGVWVQEGSDTLIWHDLEATNHLPLYGKGPYLISTNGLDEGSAGLATVDYTKFFKTAAGRRDCYLPIREKLPEERPEGSVIVPFYLNSEEQCTSDLQAAEGLLRSTPCGENGVSPVIALEKDCLHNPPSKTNLANLNAQNRLVGLSPNGAEIEVVGDRPSWLISPYPWDEGHWKAEVDGGPAKISQINLSFVGVKIPAGRHEIRIHHYSPRMYLGLEIAFATSILLFVLAVLTFKTLWKKIGILEPALLISVSLAVAIFFGWSEQTYLSRSAKMLSLNNNYSELLKTQLLGWER